MQGNDQAMVDGLPQFSQTEEQIDDIIKQACTAVPRAMVSWGGRGGGLRSGGSVPWPDRYQAGRQVPLRQQGAQRVPEGGSCVPVMCAQVSLGFKPWSWGDG